jgi:hypothetical protein
MMSDYSLSSLLPRSTITWQNRWHESTVDLVLVNEKLSSLVVACKTYLAEYSSNHQAIETTFGVTIPKYIVESRLLFKNASWKAINQRIKAALGAQPTREGMQQ